MSKSHSRESLATFRRIVQYDKMIASGTFPGVQDFMREFEISEATVHRDLDALRYDFGADDYLKYDRNKKGYHYTSPTFRIPALLTTERQIVAAELMSNLLRLIKGTPIYSEAIEVFASLSSNIEQNEKLNAKKLSGRVLFLGMSSVQIADETFSKLENALGENRYIKFDYEKDNATYRISMKPYQLIFYQGMWTLFGYETNKNYEGLKMFNLPEIKNLEVCRETFELPKDYSYEHHAIGNFGKFIGSETYLFKIKITAKWISDYAKTYNWAADQTFEDLDDGSTVMSFTSNQYFPVLHWVLEKGKFAIPLSPERLVNDWKDNARKMAQIVDKI